MDPPAPQVMSQKLGPYETRRSIRSKRFSTPSSVLGGKNSKEKAVWPCSVTDLILSTTFIVVVGEIESQIWVLNLEEEECGYVGKEVVESKWCGSFIVRSPLR